MKISIDDTPKSPLGGDLGVCFMPLGNTPRPSGAPLKGNHLMRQPLGLWSSRGYDLTHINDLRKRPVNPKLIVSAIHGFFKTPITGPFKRILNQDYNIPASPYFGHFYKRNLDISCFIIIIWRAEVYIVV